MSPSEWQLSDVRSLRDGVAALDSDYLERSASALGLSELRQELFLRYYGDAFSPEQRKKILAAIADYWRRKEAAQDA